MIPSTPLSLLLSLSLPSLGLAVVPRNAILLSDVQSLTLRGNGAMTAHRRVPAIPQLKCVSRNKAICNLFDIEVMRCTNQGSGYDDQDIQWSCTATLPEELKLGSTDVICEGYSSPDDPYILKGSCGVEYRLMLTSKGHHRYPDIDGGGGGWFDNGNGGTDWGAWLFTVIFVGILVWIIYAACCSPSALDRHRPQRRRPGFGGGGWHPGWGPDNDPPPPYPGTKPGQEGWRPGFWSGVAGGAAAGYMAGNRNNQTHNNNGYGSFGGGGGWGGSSNSRSSSGSSGGSGGRHESTGFGSTSRR